MTMTPKHTAGPWRVKRGPFTAKLGIYGWTIYKGRTKLVGPIPDDCIQLDKHFEALERKAKGEVQP